MRLQFLSRQVRARALLDECPLVRFKRSRGCSARVSFFFSGRRGERERRYLDSREQSLAGSTHFPYLNEALEIADYAPAGIQRLIYVVTLLRSRSECYDVKFDD